MKTHTHQESPSLQDQVTAQFNEVLLIFTRQFFSGKPKIQ